MILTPAVLSAQSWHCLLCRVGWRGPVACWLCGEPGQRGPLPDPNTRRTV